MSSVIEQESVNMTETWDSIVVAPLSRCCYLLNPSYRFEDETEQKNQLAESMSCYFKGECPSKHKFRDCEYIDVNGEKQYGFCKHNTGFRP